MSNLEGFFPSRFLVVFLGWWDGTWKAKKGVMYARCFKWFDIKKEECVFPSCHLASNGGVHPDVVVLALLQGAVELHGVAAAEQHGHLVESHANVWQARQDS